MPYAGGLSVKSFQFDEKGNEVNMDYERLLSIVKDSNYSGYFGIEFEGEELSPEEGIQKTRALVNRLW